MTLRPRKGQTMPKHFMDIAHDDDELTDGEPCEHPGCLSHVSHPCEGCGRKAGRTPDPLKRLAEIEAGHAATTGAQWRREGPVRFHHGQTIWSGAARLFGNQFECTEADFQFVLDSHANTPRMVAVIRGLVREIQHDSVLVDGACQQCDAGDVNEHGCCLDNDCVCNCNKQHRVAKRLAPLVAATEGDDGI